MEKLQYLISYVLWRLSIVLYPIVLIMDIAMYPTVPLKLRHKEIMNSYREMKPC